MGVPSENSVTAAANALLTPHQEQGEQEDVVQETLEEETQEVLEDEVETEEESEEETEDEGEESEEQSEDEGQEVGDDSADETEEEDKEPSDLITVKVDGDEYEVNLEELKKGYQLEANYTKKAQALAEDQKEVTALQSQLDEERNKYIEINKVLVQQQAQSLKQFENVDWAALKDDDPIGYVQKREEKREAEEAVRAQYEQLQVALTEQQQVDQGRMQEFVAQQNEILKTQMEGWNDPEEQKAIQSGIVKFAEKMGYTPEEMSSVSSARDLIVLNKARMFDELQEQKKVVRKKKSAPKVKKKVKASEPKGKAVKRAQVVKAKRDKLKSTHSTKDAASLMLELSQNRSIKK